MPIYEYLCIACDKHFEKLVMRRDQAVACPACASGNLEKQPSAFRFGRGPGDGSADYAASSSSCCASCTSKNCSSCGS
jgi:putative FmdB family regulatory protein